MFSLLTKSYHNIDFSLSFALLFDPWSREPYIKMSEQMIPIYTTSSNHCPTATKQELEDSCNALEELKERATNLEQEIAELKAKGLLSISMRAYKDKLDKMQGCQKNDELLVEFFTMKEGRDISALVSLTSTDHVP